MVKKIDYEKKYHLLKELHQVFMSDLVAFFGDVMFYEADKKRPEFERMVWDAQQKLQAIEGK